MASTKAKPETTTKQENNSTTTKEEVAVIENSVANDSEVINDQPQFQAVGIIKGEVKFHDDEKKKHQCHYRQQRIWYSVQQTTF